MRVEELDTKGAMLNALLLLTPCTILMASRKNGGGQKKASIASQSGGKSSGGGKKQMCKFFAKHGRCSFGNKCKFSHDNGSGSSGNGLKMSKGERKKITSLVAQELASKFESQRKKAKPDSSSKEKSDPVSKLYSLIAGTTDETSLAVQCTTNSGLNENAFLDYVSENDPDEKNPDWLTARKQYNGKLAEREMFYAEWHKPRDKDSGDVESTLRGWSL